MGAVVEPDIGMIEPECDAPAALCGIQGCVFLPEHGGDHSWFVPESGSEEVNCG